ncbi:hypothetical protein V1511DRAFT_510329 [Dipodascopsis uninucleata]
MTDANIRENLCEALDKPSYLNLVISLGLAIGMIISYVPQHLRIIIRRDSRGLSPWFLLLGVTSGTCSLANVILLSADVIGCCKSLSTGKCFAATLGVTQVALQVLMFMIIMVLFVIYFPVEYYHEYRQAITVAVMSVIHCSFVVVFSVIFYVSKSDIAGFAGFLGIQATILALLQYLPQIYTTCKLRQAESLSIHTLCMQAPGGFIWTLSLAMRRGTSWSSWLPYFVAAILQTLLLAMCLYYENLRGQNNRGCNVSEQEMEEESHTISLFEDENDEEDNHFD